MQVICVSRGTYGGGRDLAEKLASKLGCACLSREDLTFAATKAGIPVGKLEMAVVRRRPFDEAMATERDRLIAFITASIVDKALDGGVVYHGRTGHLVLPRVDQVLRIRAIMQVEARTALTMGRLGLDRDKARRYNEEVDDDRRRWVRALYNVDWEDPSLYDVVVNFDHVTIENTASALVAMAQLPEFQSTPASRKMLEDLRLASKCRLAIGDDPRTRNIDVKVRADNGKVTVTYPPRHSESEEAISTILMGVGGVQESTCTMAATGILWIQERYDPEAVALPQIVEVARKWNAAVRLVRLVPTEVPAAEGAKGVEEEPASDEERTTEDNAGILDDDQDAAPAQSDDGGTTQTLDKLIQHGCAGGRATVRGGPMDLVRSMDRTASVSLVVLGDVFLSKGESIRKRETRELAAYLGETLRVPVIGTGELKEHYLFGASQWIRMLTYLAVSVLVFGLVMTHQDQVITFFTAPGMQHKIMAAAVLAVVVPVFAYVWGGFTQHLLRLAKFE